MNCITSLKISAGLTALAALLVAESPANSAPNPNKGIAPPNSSMYGLTYSGWAAAWWTWALETPGSVNPLTDFTGVNATQNQSGPVWFLAGVWGAEGPVTRQCTIPAGKGLFFPFVNSFIGNAGWAPEDDINAIVADWRAQLQEQINGATDLACEVDGIPVKNLPAYREQSAIFSPVFPEDNLFGIPELAQYTDWVMVDEGYYLLLAPLSKGQHTIHFHAQLGSNPPMDVTYHLTVD